MFAQQNDGSTSVRRYKSLTAAVLLSTKNPKQQSNANY